MNSLWYLMLLSAFLFLISAYNAEAIDVTSCGVINSSGKYDLVNDVSSYGTCLNISSISNVELDCHGNNINFVSYNFTPNSSIAYVASGIVFQNRVFGTNASNITVKNCNIHGDGRRVYGSRLIGIYLDFSDDVLLFNNSINLSAYDRPYGIFADDVTNVNASNNHIYLESMHDANGFLLTGTDNFIMDSNLIESYGLQGGKGIYLTAQYLNPNTNPRILRNIIKIGRPSTTGNYGIVSAATRGLLSKENKIYVDGTSYTKAMYFEWWFMRLGGNSGDFISDELHNPPYEWIYSDRSQLNFTNVSFITGNGSIKISNFVLNGSLRYNIDKRYLDIVRNRAYVLTFWLPELNNSSTITLLNTNVSNPIVEVEFGFGNYSYCPPTLCQIKSAFGGNITFNVDHFTSYRVAQLTCLLCGDVNMDGVVSSADALVDARIANRLIVPNPLQFVCGDVNRDGTINVLDALLIARKSAGFPVVLRCV